MARARVAPTPTRAAREPQARDARPLAEPDLQSLLAHALAELATKTGAARAAAWWTEPGGTPRVIAAAGADPPLRAPSAAEYAALAKLDGAVDLGALDVGASASVIALGYAAAAPITPAPDGAAALLLLGGGAVDAPGAVRPRVLAALEAAARRAAPPLATALAHARLARLDADVCRLDRLVALGTLVAEVVHEVRNPLVSVKTFLQLLPERRDDPEFLQSFLDIAGDELQRIERLLDLLLDQASPRLPAPEEERGCEIAAVAAAVERLVAHRAAAAGIRFETEVPASLRAESIAPDALRQVLLNLVLNALDVTPPGGDVRIAARAIGRGREIDVEDRGPGIPRALRRRVFEPFFSTKPDRPGGLGLAISRRLVEEAGGTLVASDRPEGGTRFRLRLP
jgi:signal transduction histidine kinase